MVKCSLGICVYNEEKNIEKLLISVLNQKLKQVKVDEIIVISSGSTDKTHKIVKKYCLLDKRIKLIKQKLREGKASAVNLFLKNVGNQVLVLLGADLLLSENLIELLVKEFKDKEVGMTGSHPVPVNKSSGLSNFAGNLLWELHHRVSLEKPKMGEVIAFRRIFKRIPISSSVDEANIEPLIRGQGYIIKYIPDAKIYNKAPTNLKDFIKQRRRIYCGHLVVKYEQGYKVSTMNTILILRIILSYLKDNPRPKFLVYIPFVILLEAYSRFLGWWDYKVAKKKHHIWDMIETTKDL